MTYNRHYRATTTDDLVFTVGQIPLTPDSDLPEGETVEIEAVPAR